MLTYENAKIDKLFECDFPLVTKKTLNHLRLLFDSELIKHEDKLKTIPVIDEMINYINEFPNININLNTNYLRADIVYPTRFLLPHSNLFMTITDKSSSDMADLLTIKRQRITDARFEIMQLIPLVRSTLISEKKRFMRIKDEIDIMESLIKHRRNINRTKGIKDALNRILDDLRAGLNQFKTPQFIQIDKHMESIRHLIECRSNLQMDLLDDFQTHLGIKFPFL